MSDTEHAAETVHGHDHGPQSPYCLNCHYTLPAPRPRFCGHCGQETDLHPPSVREMLTEYLGHYVALDGPLWRTLWALVMIPGHLTMAYFHGRRRRYVLPLRVYLSASFLFFVGSHLLAPHEPESGKDRPVFVSDDAGKTDEDRASDATAPAPPASGLQASGPQAQHEAEPLATGRSAKPGPGAGSHAADEEVDTARAVVRETGTAVTENLSRSLKIGHADARASEPGCDLDHVNKNCSSGERWLANLIERAENMTRAQWEAKIRATAPYGMLAMQPFFAALLLMMFAGSGRRYAEHFVFSLHSHSLWFLALLLVNAGASTSLMMLAVFWHGTLALRCVYGLSGKGAFWRGLWLSLGYLLLLTFGMVLLLGLIAALA